MTIANHSGPSRTTGTNTTYLVTRPMTAGGKPASARTAKASGTPSHGFVRPSPESAAYDVEPRVFRATAKAMKATRLARTYTARYWVIGPSAGEYEEAAGAGSSSRRRM